MVTAVARILQPLNSNHRLQETASSCILEIALEEGSPNSCKQLIAKADILHVNVSPYVAMFADACVRADAEGPTLKTNKSSKDILPYTIPHTIPYRKV